MLYKNFWSCVMRNYIKKSFIIKESNLDCYNKLSYFELMKMLEEVAGLHSASMGMSMSDLKNKDNGSWVISKIKIDFAGEFPVSGEKLQVFSYPTKPTLIKNERNFVLNVNGKPFANVCSVWCIIDIDTRKSILTTKLNSLPKNFKFHKNELDNMKFLSVDKSILQNTEAVLYEKQVELSDLDINNHLNNCVYTKIVVDALGKEFFDNVNVKSYEVHFLKEVLLKEKIEVSIKNIENRYFVIGKVENENVFVAIVETL